MAYDLILGDILTWAATYDGPPFHALICDPPYHLTEITRRFGAEDAAPAQYGTDGAFQRASKGFMGKKWDGGRIAFEPETWAALARHLYPGGYGIAFASTRGYHRMACAIEDAGLIIHTQLGWAFGSGFPKATNPAMHYTAMLLRMWLIDHPDAADRLTAARAQGSKAYQTERKRLLVEAGLIRIKGEKKHAPKFAAAELGYREKNNGFNSRERETFTQFDYCDPVAAALSGYRYGGQAIKPAFEPIVLFQKPYGKSAIDSILETGAGALWIDGARIGTEEIGKHSYPGQLKFGVGGKQAYTGDASPEYMTSAGRWPANLMLAHNPDCGDTCTPGCAIVALGVQSGESESRKNMVSDGRQAPFYQAGTTVTGGYSGVHGAQNSHDDSGTAARFFFNADYVLERLEASDMLQYVAKASTGEREAGLDPRQVAFLRALGESVEDIDPFVYDRDQFPETTIDDGRLTPIDNPYQRGETTRRNTHPTIKPLTLIRHLATLLLPPDRYAPRRIMVPFAGVASEMIGCLLANWDEVIGIELTEEHIPIGLARLAYWQANKHKFDQGQPIKVKGAPAAPQGQADMFTDDFDGAIREAGWEADTVDQQRRIRPTSTKDPESEQERLRAWNAGKPL